MKIAVDNISRAALDRLLELGHEVVAKASIGEKDAVWLSRALSAGAEVVVSTDSDLSRLCFQFGVYMVRPPDGAARQVAYVENAMKRIQRRGSPAPGESGRAHLESLDEFIRRAQDRPFPSNAYVREPGWHRIYLRYGPRIALGRVYDPVLDFANIELGKKYRGQGLFTKLINRLRSQYPGLHICVENTHDRFGSGLLRMGFIDVTDTNYQQVFRSYLLKAEP